MAQNLLLAAAALKVKARPIAGFRAKMIAQALDIASDNEDPVYLIYVGA
jgi:nitroreductase